MRWLFEVCAEKWAHEGARRLEWRGLAVYGVDGTTARVPDSPENRLHFGSQPAGGERGTSGHPLVRIVTLMALRTHQLVAVRFGPYSLGEVTYAKGLWAQVPDNALVIVDRNFFDSTALYPLHAHGANRHWLIRTKSNLKWRSLKTHRPG